MSNRWLLRFPTRPDASVRLVCVPGAGCSAAMYHPWADALPEEVEVCAVQPPGRGSRLREAPFTRMAPLADALAEALLAEFDRPVVLFGHSLGALIAFEVAERLSRFPETTPAALIVAAHKAPVLGSARLPHHLLPEEDLVRVVEALGGTPDGVFADSNLRRMVLPALRADFELDYHYEHRPCRPLSIPVSVFGGDADAIVSVDELEAWRVHTTADFHLRVVSGGHFFHNEPGGAAMFANLSAALPSLVQQHKPMGERKSPYVRG